MLRKMALFILLILLQLHSNRAEPVPEICGTLPAGHTYGAAAYDGVDSIFFLGGQAGSGQLNTVVQYDVNTYQSKIVGRFPRRMDSIAAATTGNGDIFTFGGFTGQYRETEIYKLSGHNPTPEVVNHLSRGASLISAVAVGSTSIFLFGGFEISDQISHHNATTNTLKLVGILPIDLESLATVYDGENVFVFGGNHFNSAIYKFDPIAFSLETLNLTTKQYLETNTAQYIGKGESILISRDMITKEVHFTRFHHKNETLEEFQVDFKRYGSLYYPTSANVSKNKKLYFHGNPHPFPFGPGSENVYCMELDITCPWEGLVLLPHPRNCSLYYICSDGKLVNSSSILWTL